MKNYILKVTIIVFAFFLFTTTSCQSSTKTKEVKGITSKGEETSVEVEVFDAIKLKDEIVATIQSMPKTSDVASLLNESKASYIIDLTIPVKNAEKLFSYTQLSMGLGMFAFDMQYATAYNRTDQTAQIGIVEKKIVSKLGLEGELYSSENYIGRIKENSDNKDSVDYLVIQAINFCHQQFINGTHPDIYALSVIGANIEALYVLTQMSNYASNNKALLKILSEQSQRFESVYSLLELLSDNVNIKPYFEKWEKITQIIKEKGKIGESELLEITPIIETIRNGII